MNDKKKICWAHKKSSAYLLLFRSPSFAFALREQFEFLSTFSILRWTTRRRQRKKTRFFYWNKLVFVSLECIPNILKKKEKRQKGKKEYTPFRVVNVFSFHSLRFIIYSCKSRPHFFAFFFDHNNFQLFLFLRLFVALSLSFTDHRGNRRKSPLKIRCRCV